MINSNHPEDVKVFSVVMILLGFGIIYGTAKKWTILINPPRWWAFYFMNLVRDNFEQDGLELCNYVMGFSGIIGGILLFIFT